MMCLTALGVVEMKRAIFDGIPRVVFFCTNVKVSRIDATCIVAAMANKHVIWHIHTSEHEGISVCPQ